jgi:hypothetical protein
MMRLSSSDLQATLMLSLNSTNSGDMINHESRKVDLDALLGDRALASSNDSSDDSMSPLTSQDAGKPRLAEDIFKAAEERVADDLSPQRRLAQEPWKPADSETMPLPALEPQNNGNGHGSASDLNR